MPTITKRNDTYKITVSAGYDINGKQIRKHLTWKPSPGMTAKQIEKELNRQAFLFEEKVRNGTYLDGSIKFSDFAEQWFNEYANEQLRATTLQRYKSMLPRINAAIGHMKLERIQPQHLLSFYKNLAETGIREDMKYKANCDLHALIKAKKLTFKAVADNAGIGERTVSTAVKGTNITEKTARAICDVLNMPIDKVFTVVDEGKTLSSSAIRHHHGLISSILATAVQWQIIFSNPCDRVKPPKIGKPDPKYLDEEQARQMIEHLEGEDIQFRVMIELLMFTGLRRGELLGLEWSDVDFDNKIIQVCRSSLYLPEKGVFEDETKTTGSRRAFKVSQGVIDLLKEQRAYQTAQRLKTGDKWQNSNRLFTSWNGAPLNPTYLTSKFRLFKAKHNIEDISVHGLRHTNATLQIAAGTPLTTVAHRLGHANASTTTKIYAHAIKSADEVAAEAIADILTPNRRLNKA